MQQTCPSTGVHPVHNALFGEQGRPLAGILSTQSLPQIHFQMLRRLLVLCHLLQTSIYVCYTSFARQVKVKVLVLRHEIDVNY